MKKTFIVLVMLSFVLVACANGGEQFRQDQPFIGGNAAVNLYLQNGMPPPTVFDGGDNPFGIGVVMENIGEADIGPGTENPFFQLRLEGLLPENFGLTDSDVIQEPSRLVRGSQKNFDGTIIPGEAFNAIFSPLNFQRILQGNQVHGFRVSACYDYTNRATAVLCMKDDVMENVQDSTLCTLTGPKPVANSGGPIHVTSVRQNPMEANKIQVNIQISHVGTGEFFGRTADETCNTGQTNMNRHNVHVEIETDDPNAIISCNMLDGGSSGTIRMFGGSPQLLSCTVQGPESAARIYQTGLDVTLQYRYGEFIEDRFIVMSAPRAN